MTEELLKLAKPPARLNLAKKGQLSNHAGRQEVERANMDNCAVTEKLARGFVNNVWHRNSGGGGMTAATPIAAMVEHLFAAGAAPESIVKAIEPAESASRRQVALRTPETRGTRLAEGWTPSDACVAFALSRGMTIERLGTETERVRNYWLAKSGRDATKRDWDATWRNWCIRAMEMRHGATHNYRSYSASRPPATGADAVLAGMGRLALRVVENRNAARSCNRQISSGSDGTLELDLECK
jgi:hypothetical protein